MRYSFRLLPVLLLFLSTVPAEASSLEKIIIAPDNWTFIGKETGKRFVPFGVNYTPGNWASGVYWTPDYFAKSRWDEKRIAADFDDMASLGVNTVKMAFGYSRILPDPQSPGSVVPDPAVLERFEKMLDIAGERGIRLIVAVQLEWAGIPDWFWENGYYFGEGIYAVWYDFWEQFAKRYAGDGRIFAYSFAVEANISGWDFWKNRQLTGLFREWLKSEYADITAVADAWKTPGLTWETVEIPGHDGWLSDNWRDLPENTNGNEHNTNDQRLFDYLQFREYLYFRYIYAMHRGVKAGDPEALTTMGFIQYNPIMRNPHHHLREGLDSNVKELSKAMDILGIHFYPMYPGVDWPEIQMEYLELWARYAYCGKPVILEEFNSMKYDNAWWCTQVIKKTRDDVSGWLVWTFRDTPRSDTITKKCGLYDRNGKIKKWGKKFKKLSRKATRWKLKRAPGERTVQIDKKWLYTSGDYLDLIWGLLTDKDERPVEFIMESNRSIDRFIEQTEKQAQD